MTSWTSPGQCSTCKFCAMEPDDMNPFCVHPTVLSKYSIGLHINSAIDIYCTDKLIMREERN